MAALVSRLLPRIQLQLVIDQLRVDFQLQLHCPRLNYVYLVPEFTHAEILTSRRNHAYVEGPSFHTLLL